MALHVMYRYYWYLPACGEPLCEGCADHERPDQAGASGIGHALNAVGLNAGIRNNLINQWQQATDVIPRGQFWHDAAILGVHRYLAVQRVCEKAALVKFMADFMAAVHGNAGFIAGAFDPENGAAIGPNAGC